MVRRSWTRLTVLSNAQPVFTTVKRVITENGHKVVSDNPASGLLDADATTRLRQAIRAYLKTNAPNLPISIYAAGKMSQLLMVPEVHFSDNITLANTAYVAACTGAGVPNAAASFSPLFPAFLGVCLLDGNLTTFLQAGPGSDADEAIEEFGIDPDPAKPDLKVVNQLTAGSFITAQTNLLSSAAWQGGCGSQFLFWKGGLVAAEYANRRAILP